MRILRQPGKTEIADPLATLAKSATNADEEPIPPLERVSFRDNNA